MSENSTPREFPLKEARSLVTDLAEPKLWMDVGRGEVLKLPPETRDEWWEGTTREWPFMATDLGISRDTLMAHYLSNHVAVAYGDVFEEMVALSQELGFRVRILGNID
jgi:L-fucose isomerase-like protein